MHETADNIPNSSLWKNKQITVMGLGLHGGGLSIALFLYNQGARLTVTDLRDENTLAPSINTLKNAEKKSEQEGIYPIVYRLGCHKEEDFLDADIVVKNPGVSYDNKYLKLASQIESDLSIFFKELEFRQVKPFLVAVTGSKGKSTTVSALKHTLDNLLSPENIFLGGNITVSPLTFINLLNNESILILELSSWQLHDLAPHKVFLSNISAITNIFHEHQNRYAKFQDYVDDKLILAHSTEKSGVLFISQTKEDPSISQIPNATKAKLHWINDSLDQANDASHAYWKQNEGFYSTEIKEALVPSNVTLLGKTNKVNLLLTACLTVAIVKEKDPRNLTKHLVAIPSVIASFPGVPHRLEYLHDLSQKSGYHYFNDSAATLPAATLSSVQALSSLETSILIIGGTDKNSDYSPLENSVFSKLKHIFILPGSAQESIQSILKTNTCRYTLSPNLHHAITKAHRKMEKNDILLLSPGAASFEFYKNEFDRGDSYKKELYEYNKF